MLNQFRTWVVWVTFFVSVTSTDEDLNLPLLYVLFCIFPQKSYDCLTPISLPFPWEERKVVSRQWAQIEIVRAENLSSQLEGDLIRTFPKSWYCQWPKILGYCTNCNGNSNLTRLLSESFQILRICLGQLVSGAHKWQANTTAPISILTVCNT